MYMQYEYKYNFDVNSIFQQCASFSTGRELINSYYFTR